MKYELAKELKDAGFPQTGKGELRADKWESASHLTTDPTIATSISHTSTYFPTLSELIEACEKSRGDFCALESDRYNGTYSGAKWLAYSWGLSDDGYRSDDVSCMEFWENPPAEIARGATPEEAVARLWLALTNHKNISH